MAEREDNRNSHPDPANLIPALFEDLLFHRTGLNVEDGLEDTDMHMDFWNDPKEEIQRKLIS